MVKWAQEENYCDLKLLQVTTTMPSVQSFEFWHREASLVLAVA